MTLRASPLVNGQVFSKADVVESENAVYAHIAVIKDAPINLAAPEYALVTGTSVDSALTAAKAAIPARGGEILIPSGDYTSTALPSFDDTRNVTILGQGGQNAGAQGTTRVTSSKTGSAAVLSARSSFRFALKNLQLEYSNSGLTGPLIDFGWSASNLDSAYFTVEGCYLGGSGGVNSASSLASVTKAIIGEFTDTTFGAAQRHIRGLGTGTDYSNVMLFTNCTFLSHVLASIASTGESWQFDVCNWAAKSDGSAGAFLQDQGVFEGLNLNACWFGDVNTLGTWFNGSGHGLNVNGGNMGGGARGFLIGNGSKAFDIRCMTFDTVATPIEFGSACSGHVGPNRYLSSTTGPVVDGGTLSASTQGIIGQTDSDTYLRGRWKATEGLHLPTKAGVFSDTDFPTDRPPITGLVGGVDTTNNRLYVRVGSTWRYATLT